MTKCQDDFGDPCPGTGDPECADCVFLMANPRKTEMKLMDIIRHTLGNGKNAMWRSARECALIMHGVRYTSTQVDTINTCLRRMWQRGELDKAKKYSHMTGNIVDKFKLKGTHPRW